MAKTRVQPGRFLALEGIRNADLILAGKHLLRSLGASKNGGVSTWDASAIFFELCRAKKRYGVPSPKTLLMLYASDLAFRLRWEIQPALEEGQTVIAAPYIDTALALGAAAGVPKDWTLDLFNFAPKPEATYGLREREEPSYWTGQRSAGFIEFCCATLAVASDQWHQAELRKRAIGYLNARRLKTVPG